MWKNAKWNESKWNKWKNKNPLTDLESLSVDVCGRGSTVLHVVLRATSMRRLRPERCGMQIPVCSSTTYSSPRPLRLHLNSASTVTAGNSQTQQEPMFASLIFGLTVVASRAWSHLTHPPLDSRFMIYLHRNGLSPAGTDGQWPAVQPKVASLKRNSGRWNSLVECWLQAAWRPGKKKQRLSLLSWGPEKQKSHNSGETLWFPFQHASFISQQSPSSLSEG